MYELSTLSTRLKFSGRDIGIIAGSLLSFIVVVGTLRTLDTWNADFFATGPKVALYNLTRAGFFVFLIAACRGAGALIPLTRMQPFDRFVVGSTAGFAILELGGALLGIAGLLGQWSTLIVLLAATGAAGASAQIRSEFVAIARAIPRYPIATALWFTAITLFVALRGLPPDITTNDFGHYLPYLRRSIVDGSSGPNTFFMHFFYSKGAGLNLLTAGIVDPVTAQLVGVLAIVLAACAVFRLVATLTHGSVVTAALVATTAMLMPSVVFFEPEKIHAHIALFVIFLAYQTTIIGLYRANLRQLYQVRWLVVGAAAAASPPSLLLTGPILFFDLVNCWLARRRERLRNAALTIAIAVASTATVLALNYVLSGLFEYTPHTIMIPLANKNIVAGWLDPFILNLQMAYNEGQQSYLSADIFLSRLKSIDETTRDLLYAWLIGLPVAFWINTKFAKRAYITLAPIAAAAAAGWFLSLVAAQDSAERYLLFMKMLPPILYVATFGLGLALFVRLPLARYTTLDARRWIYPVAILALWPLTSAGWLYLSRNYADRIDFLRGRTSLAAAYQGYSGQGYPAPACVAAAHALPPGTRVLPLNFAPGCYVIPVLSFERPDFGRINTRASAVILGTAQAAADAYRALGLKYFLVDLNNDTNFIFHAFSPLFDSESVQARFRVRVLTPTVFLLVLDGDDRDGEKPGTELLRLFQNKRSADRNGPFGLAITRISRDCPAHC